MRRRLIAISMKNRQNSYNPIIVTYQSTRNFMLNPNLKSKFDFNLRKGVKNWFWNFAWADCKNFYTTEILRLFGVCIVKIRLIQSFDSALRNFAINRSFCSLSPPREKFENPNPYDERQHECGHIDTKTLKIRPSTWP